MGRNQQGFPGGGGMTPLLIVARGYARRNWPVCPLHSVGPDGCSCGRPCPSPGKHPRTAHGLSDASTDLAAVDDWWTQHPDASIAVRTGRAPEGAGIWVLDLDIKDGPHARDAVVAASGGDAESWATLTARTGGGGTHHVYCYGPDLIAWLAAERLTLPSRNTIGGIRGLDVRSDGGYIVAVPSMHASGRRYEWEDRRDAIDAPEWLIRLVAKPMDAVRVAPPSLPVRPPADSSAARYGSKVLDNACARVANAIEGERHAVLLAQAKTVGGYLVSGAISRDHAESALCTAGAGCGKPASEVQRTVRDGLAYGQREPIAILDRDQRPVRPALRTASDDPGRAPEPVRPSRIDEARAVMARAVMALYADQATKAERLAVARELAGSVDLLADVASSAAPEWATWCATIGAGGGFGEHLREIRRAVAVVIDGRKAAAKETRKAASSDDRRWCDRLAVNEEGKVKSTFANIITILRNDTRYASLRMSTLGGVVEVAGDELDEGPATADLCEWLRDAYSMDAGEVSAKSALYAVAQGRAYSPVRDYLESVRSCAGDDMVVGRLLRECLGIRDPTAMQAAMLGRFLISAVARALHPGCKVDTALVLVGEQGAKKSSFFAGLFGAFFGDSPIPIGNKDAPITMSRVWGYEAAELEDLTSKRSAGAVKQFLGSSRDLYRPPFARTAILQPRHTVLCGSINPEGGMGGSAAFLSDPSGSRRFWILTVPPRWVVPMPELLLIRDAAWGWALKEYEAGERWWFDRSEDGVREDDAQQYQIEDVWQSSVFDWLGAGPSLFGCFTTADVLAGLNIDVQHRTQREAGRVKAILVRLGWVERHSAPGYRNKRVWMRPQADTDGRVT